MDIFWDKLEKAVYWLDAGPSQNAIGPGIWLESTQLNLRKIVVQHKYINE